LTRSQIIDQDPEKVGHVIAQRFVRCVSSGRQITGTRFPLTKNRLLLVAQ
jgi:hypothetical protein